MDLGLSSVQAALASIRQGDEIPLDHWIHYLSRAKSILQTYPCTTELLLPCLRLIRDCLAIRPQDATSALLSSRGWADEVEGFAWLLKSVEALIADEDEAVLTALSQLLANLASNGHLVDNGSRSIWSLIFPSLLFSFTSHPSPKVASPGTACLYKLCLSDESCSKELCSPSGRDLWEVLLERSLHEEEQSEWLPLLVSCVTLRQGLLEQLVAILADEGGRWSRFHPAILHLLASELQEMLGTVPEHHSQHFLNTVTGMVYDSMAGCRMIELEEEGSIDLNLSRHILEASLEALRALFSRDNQGVSLFGFDPAQWLLQMNGKDQPLGMSIPRHRHSWIELLFSSLGALGPPTKPRNNLLSQVNELQASSPDDPARQAHPAKEAQPASPLSSLVSLLPHAHPYTGYRGDILAILSNMVTNRPEVADQICSLPLLPSLPPHPSSSHPHATLSNESVGLVELLLSQAQLDDESPVAREWALLTLRNLCLISEEARTRIEGLELSSEDQSIETEDMKRMGMRLERNKETGKVELKRGRAECSPRISHEEFRHKS